MGAGSAARPVCRAWVSRLSFHRDSGHRGKIPEAGSLAAGLEGRGLRAHEGHARYLLENHFM